MLSLALVVLAQLSVPSPAVAQAATVSTIKIVVDDPVYTGQPVWIRATNGPIENIRYPFAAAAGELGCNRLEVKRDGVLLTPTTVPTGATTWNGLACGSAAPPGSPTHRLPLHIRYPMSEPGTYSVRLTVESLDFSGGSVRTVPFGQSDWLTFKVLKTSPEQHEAWLTHLLANAPQDEGQLAGDFLPSLLAAAPDRRALDAFVSYLYAGDSMVSGMAASCLEAFPQVEAMRAVADALVKRGPSDQLAYFVSYHRGWTGEDEDRIMHAAIPYLLALTPTLPIGRQAPGVEQTQAAGALKLLRFIVYVPNHAWPEDRELKAYADAEVVKAAPRIMAEGNMQTVQELVLTLGAMDSSPRVHELIVEIAKRTDNAGNQARIGLTWHPQPSDLALLAAVLTAPGDKDPRGTDRSSLPGALVNGYGEAALPYLEKAVADSPYVWVRVQSAQQLALKNRLVGFRFLLDAIETNKPYKAEMVRWVRDMFRRDLAGDAPEEQVAEFLRKQSGP